MVGNAIKYTNEDGNIWVGVYKRGEEIIFWIENETENIQKLVDAGEWTEAEATEALEYYDEILKSILEGKMVGKRASSSDDQLFFSMPDNAQPEQYQTFVFDGNTYKRIGPFDTEEELFNALKEYTDTEVEAGTMSQAEATALFRKVSIEICRTTAKEKSRRTADTFPCVYEAAALRKIRAAVSFRLS